MGGVETDAFNDRGRRKCARLVRPVLYTLTNRVHAGLVVDTYGFRDGCHEAVVERTVHHAVLNLLTLRRSRAPGRTTPPLPWPLLGLIVCGGCDRSISTHTIRRSPMIYRYYRCRSALRQVVFKADTGRIEILFQPSGDVQV